MDTLENNTMKNFIAKFICGLFFIIGTVVILTPGTLFLIAGTVSYCLGHMAIDYYRDMKI